MDILQDSPVAQARISDNVLIVEFDNPPVNAISLEIRRAIIKAVEFSNAQSLTAVVFCARGRTFFSGADIREFNQEQQEIDLPGTLAVMDSAQTPMIALLHGTVLGGGLEFALRCDARLAHPRCRFGFPEVNLGLIPGAGGTQLLPRLISTDLAVEMVCQGAMIDCSSALERGLIDALLPTDKIDTRLWIDLVLQQIKTGELDLRKRRLRDLPPQAPTTQQMLQWQEAVTKKARGQTSPVSALQALVDGLSTDIDSGLSREREIFLACKTSSQSKALRHIFFAEKSSSKLSRLAKDHAPASVLERCAVIGCGTMGAGIGGALLHTGARIMLIDPNQDNLQRAQQSILSRLEKMRQRLQIDEQRYRDMLDNIELSQDIHSAGNAQLVIEAVFEDKAVKQEVFAQLDKCVAADTILATNTSYIDPREIFSGVSNPGRHIGLHFFSPADVMKLLEIVVLPKTDDRTLAAAAALAKQMKKIAVWAQPEFGFVANRSYMAYGQAVQDLLLAGNTPEQIDTAMTNFGMAMGPLSVLDMSGIDIGHFGRVHNPNPPKHPGFFLPAATLVARGELGRKTNIGFYRYENGRKCAVNEEALQVILAKAQEIGIAHRPLDADGIVASVLDALVREGRRLVDTGVSQRVSDIDVVWVNGYGFPRWRGGPMYYAQPSV